MLTDRDIQVPVTVADLGRATAAQLRRLVFPKDPDGRICRRRLQALLSAGLLQKTRMEVVNPLSGLNCPVYYSSRKGLEFLAMHFKDGRYLSLSCQRPQWQTLAHQVAVADLHILVNAAAAWEAESAAKEAREKMFAVENFTSEWDVVNKDAEAPEDKYCLYTLLSKKPRLCVCPDYMFIVRGAGGARVLLGELERGTNHPEKAAAEKSPGFAELYRRKSHRRFCADAGDKFLVLVTAPDARWRDHLVKAFATKQEPTLYRFAALPELTPENFFKGPVWKRCDGKVGALLKDSVAAAVPVGVRAVSAASQNGRAGVMDTST